MHRQSRSPTPADRPDRTSGIREPGRIADTAVPKKSIRAGDRRVWAAMLFPSGVVDVLGALCGSPRLHWTPRAARAEAQEWVEGMRIGPITWESIDDQVIIGRALTHYVVIRSILLPFGRPPRDDEPADPTGPGSASRDR